MFVQYYRSPNGLWTSQHLPLTQIYLKSFFFGTQLNYSELAFFQSGNANFSPNLCTGEPTSVRGAQGLQSSGGGAGAEAGAAPLTAS